MCTDLSSTEAQMNPQIQTRNPTPLIKIQQMQLKVMTNTIQKMVLHQTALDELVNDDVYQTSSQIPRQDESAPGPSDH